MEEEVAVAILGVAFLFVSGGVLLLRPIVVRLGDLLDLANEERRARIGHHSGGVPGVPALEHLEERLRRVEHRLEFAEGILDPSRPGHRDSLAAGSADAPPPPSGGEPMWKRGD